MLGRVFTSSMRPNLMAAAKNITRNKSSMAPNRLTYANRDHDFKKTWMMDKATYPIVVIISFATTMCVTFTAHKFFKTPDNRVDPAKRSALLRYWH